jgi:hypothetical protein
MQFLDLGAHLHAKLRVQIRQRLVEQEHLRHPDDRATHRDALPLPTGKLTRIAIEIGLEAEDIGGLGDVLRDLVLGFLREHQRERHVVAHRHVRIERVILEHHRDVALLRRNAVDHPPADGNLAAADFLQPGDHAQKGRLAATRRSDQHAELAVGDFDVDAADHVRRSEILAHLADAYCRHYLLLYTGGPRDPVTTT